MSAVSSDREPCGSAICGARLATSRVLFTATHGAALDCRRLPARVLGSEMPHHTNNPPPDLSGASAGWQVVTAAGTVAFDDVWVFGHADAHTVSDFMKLDVSPVLTTTSAPQVQPSAMPSRRRECPGPLCAFSDAA